MPNPGEEGKLLLPGVEFCGWHGPLQSIGCEGPSTFPTGQPRRTRDPQPAQFSLGPGGRGSAELRSGEGTLATTTRVIVEDEEELGIIRTFLKKTNKIIITLVEI